jgi:hypothetical protein
MLAGPVEVSEAVANLAVARRQQMDDSQAGAVARLIGLDNAADVTHAVGAIFDARTPVQIMHHLAGEATGNPEATGGLRKAVADHMVSKAERDAMVSAALLDHHTGVSPIIFPADDAQRAVIEAILRADA